MKNLDKVLIQLAELLNSNHINWAIGGSKLLSLSGIKLEVNDIDIMIHEHDFDRCLELLKGVSIECEVKESEIFKSKNYRKLSWDNVQIDCMSGMIIHLNENVFVYKFDCKEKEILFENISIPLCYLEDWFVLYHVMPNRESKIKIMEKFFMKHSIQDRRYYALLELNIPKDIRIKMNDFENVIMKKRSI